MTECSRQTHKGIGQTEQLTLDFPGGKPVTLAFDAEDVTSDSGLAAFGALDARLDLMAAAAQFVNDLRSPDMIVHPLDRLMREAVFAYMAGYGDACDHAPLARDPLFARLVGPTKTETRNPRATDGRCERGDHFAAAACAQGRPLATRLRPRRAVRRGARVHAARRDHARHRWIRRAHSRSAATRALERPLRRDGLLSARRHRRGVRLRSRGVTPPR